MGDPRVVVSFWRGAGPPRWFSKSDAFDRLCRARFQRAHEAAAGGLLDSWGESATGSLALAIVLDQIPRNIFRGDPRTWATDRHALAVAEYALARNFDRRIGWPLRQFLYLPFMHAEDVAAQERSVRLYERQGDPHQLGYARHHHDIVARFGRFPHRNPVLDRESTPAEIAFLAADPFRG